MANTKATTVTTPELSFSQSDNVTLTELMVRLRDERKELVNLTSEVAWLALKHYHNSNNPEKIQQVYEILAEDKHFNRKAAFVMWAKAFSRVSFSDSGKKFAFIPLSQETAKNQNYRDNPEIGSDLLVRAKQTPWHQIEGLAEDKTEPTEFDRIYNFCKTRVAAIQKKIAKGEMVENKEIKESVAMLTDLEALVAPLTTKPETVTTDSKKDLKAA
jgi:hypothetical protein